MTDIDAIIAAVLPRHRASWILRFLAELPAYTGNVPLLRDLLYAVGLPTSEDDIARSLTSLNDAGLVQGAEVSGVTVLTLTERGLDVARGRVVVDTVARPGPR